MLKSKTFWTGVAAVAFAAGGFFTGNMDLNTATQTALGGLAMIFMRQAIAKK